MFRAVLVRGPEAKAESGLMYYTVYCIYRPYMYPGAQGKLPSSLCSPFLAPLSMLYTSLY